MRIKAGYEKIELQLLRETKCKLKALAAMNNMTMQDAVEKILSERISQINFSELQ